MGKKTDGANLRDHDVADVRRLAVVVVVLPARRESRRRRAAFARAVAVRVAMAVRRGVGVHADDVHGFLVLAARGRRHLLDLDLCRRGDSHSSLLVCLRHRRRRRLRLSPLLPVLPHVELSAEEIENQSSQRRHHRDEPGERELRPWPAREARIGEGILPVGEHVDEPRGEDDPGGEGLDQDEHARVRSQEPPLPPYQRDRDSQHARRQDHHDRHQFQPESVRVVPADVGLAVGAIGVDRGFRHLPD